MFKNLFKVYVLEKSFTKKPYYGKYKSDPNTIYVYICRNKSLNKYLWSLIIYNSFKNFNL